MMALFFVFDAFPFLYFLIRVEYLPPLHHPTRTAGMIRSDFLHFVFVFD